MRIDSKRLTKDCASAQSNLIESGHMRSGTGATALIEPVLPLIRELRAQKHGWAAIAGALAKQGVAQGADRQPITARRLTALIAAIDKRERRKQGRLAARTMRRDLAPAPRSHALVLSADLNVAGRGAEVVTATEEDIRRQEFEDRVRSLLREDPV